VHSLVCASAGSENPASIAATVNNLIVRFIAKPKASNRFLVTKISCYEELTSSLEAWM
jgi:hypothetical protein